MKILYVESGTSGGGSFQSLYQHLNVINRELIDPVVVYLNNNRFITPVESLGISVYLLNDWLYSNKVHSHIEFVLHKMTSLIEKMLPVLYISFLRLTHKPLLQSLNQIVCNEKIDVIHLNVQINRDMFALFVAEKNNVPCISHLRSMRGEGFDKYRSRYANRIASMFIANSNSTKHYWSKSGLDENKIRVVYNAINMDQIQPADIRATWGIDKKVHFIIGCVASFIRGKGHYFLLKAFTKFIAHEPGSILLLAGDGPLREELVQETIRLNINNHVIFTGYVTEPQNFIAGLDLLVLPSQTEAFGRVLLEAMHAATPVVATNVGGIPEIVNDEYNGLLVNYGDEEGLNKAMERLMTDESLRSTFMENGHHTVDRFSMEKYSADLEHIYKTVLEK